MTAQPPFYGNFWDIKEEHLLQLFQHYNAIFHITTPLGLLQDFTTHINASTVLCGLHSRLALEEMQKAENLFALLCPLLCANSWSKRRFYDNFSRYAISRCFYANFRRFCALCLC